MSRLFWCLCSQCEHSDSSDIGLVCSLCKPQFTEDGKCVDFELKSGSEVVIDEIAECFKKNKNGKGFKSN